MQSSSDCLINYWTILCLLYQDKIIMHVLKMISNIIIIFCSTVKILCKHFVLKFWIIKVTLTFQNCSSELNIFSKMVTSISEILWPEGWNDNPYMCVGNIAVLLRQILFHPTFFRVKRKYYCQTYWQTCMLSSGSEL